MSSSMRRGLVFALMTAIWIAGPLSLRPAAAANPVYTCDARATLDLRAGRPVCVKGKSATDAVEVAATSQAAQQKAGSAWILFFFVLVIVSIALVAALVQFILVGIFAWKRAKVANAIASAPNTPPDNAAERIISPESAAMIVQTSRSGLAIAVVALLFFFGYLTAIYPASFAAPDRPLNTAAPSPTPSPTPTPHAKGKNTTIKHRP